MTYMAIGNLTGKTYAQGSRADCMRTLLKDYPHVVGKRGSTIIDVNVLPEPLKLQLVDRREMT